MTQFNECPVCKSKITPDKVLNRTIICSCGWHGTIPDSTKDRRNFGITGFIFLLSTSIMMIMFFHVLSWNNHFFTILPLKAKQSAGIATPRDLLKIVDICKERRKYPCMAQAYQDLFNLNKDIELLAEIGNIQQGLGDRQSALGTFERYVELGGRNSTALYHYAQILGQLGKVEQAIKYYELALEAKKDRIQISVIKSYVTLLIDSQRYPQAQKILDLYRSKGGITGFLMEKEYKVLDRMLQRKSKRS